MTFGEDQCRLRTTNAALTATTLRKMAPYLLSQTPENISNKRKRKRKRAPYDNNFLVGTLKLA